MGTPYPPPPGPPGPPGPSVVKVGSSSSSLGYVALALAMVPVLAICIPLLAVAGAFGAANTVVAMVGLTIAVLIAVAGAKSSIRLQHRLRLEELDARAELARAEAARLAEINRMVDDLPPTELN